MLVKLAIISYLRFYLINSIASSKEQAQPLQPIFTTQLSQHPMINTLLSLIAPSECIVCTAEGHVLCNKCQASIVAMPERCFRCMKITNGSRICSICRTSIPINDVWIYCWYEGIAAAAIKKYKFDHIRSASRDLARMLDAALPHITADYIVVYVPTASSRVRMRGFDHVALIAKIIAKKRSLVYLHALERKSQSRQLGSSRQARFKAMKGEFTVKRPIHVQGANILLLDDVITTGATVTEAATVLKQAGAKNIIVAAIAQTPLDMTGK